MSITGRGRGRARAGKGKRGNCNIPHVYRHCAGVGSKTSCPVREPALGWVLCQPWYLATDLEISRG